MVIAGTIFIILGILCLSVALAAMFHPMGYPASKKKPPPISALPISYCPACNEDIPITEWETHRLAHLKERAK